MIWSYGFNTSNPTQGQHTGAPHHRTTPSPRPHSHCGHWPLGPCSLPRWRIWKIQPWTSLGFLDIPRIWVLQILSFVFKSIPWLFRETLPCTVWSQDEKSGKHCQDAVRWSRSGLCGRSPEHVPWECKRYLFDLVCTAGCHHQSSHFWSLYQTLHCETPKSCSIVVSGCVECHLMTWGSSPYCSSSMVSWRGQHSPRWYGQEMRKMSAAVAPWRFA